MASSAQTATVSVWPGRDYREEAVRMCVSVSDFAAGQRCMRPNPCIEGTDDATVTKPDGRVRDALYCPHIQVRDVDWMKATPARVPARVPDGPRGFEALPGIEERRDGGACLTRSPRVMTDAGH